MYDPAAQTSQAARLRDRAGRRAQSGGAADPGRFFVGTLQYVAPETLSGELVSEQADVYSLATIAYYMLSQDSVYREEP